MLQKRLYELNELKWKVLRESLTKKVFGKSLIPQDMTDVKIILTKMEPGGEFSLHKDPYQVHNTSPKLVIRSGGCSQH